MVISVIWYIVTISPKHFILFIVSKRDVQEPRSRPLASRSRLPLHIVARPQDHNCMSTLTQHKPPHLYIPQYTCTQQRIIKAELTAHNNSKHLLYLYQDKLARHRRVLENRLQRRKDIVKDKGLSLDIAPDEELSDGGYSSTEEFKDRLYLKSIE